MTDDRDAGMPPVVERVPHRRYDPLRDSWVLVSAGRDARPWRGQVDRPPAAGIPVHDDTCQLCPGNVRASGEVNPPYAETFVFTNDFPALRPTTPAASVRDGLHVAEAEAGTARVLCFSPRHDLALGFLGDDGIRGVVDMWVAQSEELGASWRWVQVFENRGEMMGASNPHPHGQVWAGDAIPSEAVREDATQRAHLERTGRTLLDDVAAQEAGGPLEIEAEAGWLAVVPYWATWPFETLLIAPPPARRLPDLDRRAREGLAAVLGRLLRRYDRLFNRPFPYSMGWHQAPFAVAGDDDTAHWRLHAHVYPPLLRAEARKFMVGYELLAEPQRDLTPEDAAVRLREVSGATSS